MKPIEKKMSNTITLPDGKFLIRDYGKYGSGVIFISPDEELKWEQHDPREFNIFGSHQIYTIRGDYYISKAGNSCFKVNNNGKHLFILEDWGGPFGDKNIYINVLPNKLFEKNKRSNGGGAGCYYCVVPVGTKYLPNPEEYQEEVKK